MGSKFCRKMLVRYLPLGEISFHHSYSRHVMETKRNIGKFFTRNLTWYL